MNREVEALKDASSLIIPNFAIQRLCLQHIHSDEGKRRVCDILHSAVNAPHEGDDGIMLRIDLPWEEPLPGMLLDALKNFVGNKNGLAICKISLRCKNKDTIAQGKEIFEACLKNISLQNAKIEYRNSRVTLTKLVSDDESHDELQHPWSLNFYDCNGDFDPGFIKNLLIVQSLSVGRISLLDSNASCDLLETILSQCEAFGDEGSVRELFVDFHSAMYYPIGSKACQLLADRLSKITCLTKVALLHEIPVPWSEVLRFRRGFDPNRRAKLFQKYRPYFKFFEERNKFIHAMKQADINLSKNCLINKVIEKFGVTNNIYAFSMAYFILQSNAGVLFADEGSNNPWNGQHGDKED